jgi:phosphatidylglycerophosphatase A
MINKINLLIVTFFGIGNIKFAPGTWASLVTSLLLFILFHVLNISSNFVLVILLVLFIYSTFAISSCIETFEHKDPKQIVIDEVIGQSIPIYLYEISHGTEKDFDKSILFYFFIFLLFRIFDILKPFPINYFDKKYKNTFGIMFDDILAGFYVVLTLILAMIIKNLL